MCWVTAEMCIRDSLIAVHQPFTYSRTKMLFNDFVYVLKIPDITVLTPIMGSREPNDPTITSAKLAAQIPGSVLEMCIRDSDYAVPYADPALRGVLPDM